ncbi:MAG: hypothetical protein ACI4DW_04125 [Lachnospiraceae bacterium]
MADKTWNKNVRFNMNSVDAVQAWSLLHSAEVDREFKSQNEFIICAINDFYKRHISTKNDPYLETREKEDAFVDRIVEQVTAKILANIPALAGMYLLQQQTALAAGLQNGAMMNVTPVKMGADAVTASPLPVTNVETGLKNKADDNEPEENELLDFSFGM